MLHSHRYFQYILFRLLAIFLPPLFSSCAPPPSYYLKLDQSIVDRRYDEADRLVEKQQTAYGERNAVLYHLDRAMTLHLSGSYEESNRHLELAEQRMEELYTKSLTAEAGAMLTNDNLLPYEGEDFEKVMVNLLGAVNYALLGQWDDALVEARKVDHKLNLLNDRYEKKNVYKEDAFARYLSGILYEARGELNDAFIAYRNAYEAYGAYQENYGTEIPSPLPLDLLRLADALHLTEESAEYREQFPGLSFETYADLSQKGELILVSLDGGSPVKEDFFIDAPIPDGSGGTYLLRIALPRFVPVPSRVDRMEVRVRPNLSDESIPAERVEDITAIGKKNLEDRIGRITAKAIARAAAKYTAALKIRKKASEGGGQAAGAFADFLTNVFNVATEQADKRSWRTLPGEIRLARVPLSPGTYEVELIYYDPGGMVLERKEMKDIVIKAGEKKFISHRTAR
ncbi:MAG: hypothetical protein HZA19_05780 [Nitrospirae bacterium]|nr:hypothetical protein [Nitrospirota bacterium]